MIEITELTKRYGDTLAVDELSFTVRPGVVTGFLGPNGAGKSTTMRMVLGLDAPSSGTATVDGRHVRDHAAPLTKIGALLEARAVHPRRSARDHLRWLATTNGIPQSRVDEVLDLVGLGAVARRAAGGFSLGMGQRLGIAAALLGDPETIMLDEPVNGLDPEGIVWIRELLQGFAREGRAVLVSSHLMSEMALTAERFLIVGRGRLLADATGDELRAGAGEQTVTVRTPHAAALRVAIAGPGIDVRSPERGVLVVRGMSSEDVGARALHAGLALTELTPHHVSLEEAFLALTHGAAEYNAHGLDKEAIS